ncbi:MAG TPA: hypothetical protein VM901_05630 [Bdellovibrionota bacterium]|nr:hypothetical protein [Bdellovibrionota bacterium]
MRGIISLSLSLAMIGAPVANAQNRANVDAKVFAQHVAQYQKAKALHAQKGVESFVGSYRTLLSRADAQYLTTSLSGNVVLPELSATALGFTLRSSRGDVNFDLSHLDEGYALVDGARVSANFGGSLEEISASIERALKQKDPKQFGERLSALLMNSLVPSAHAGSALIWGGLVAIIGAIVFKGVYDSKTAAKKKETAKKPAYVDEPVRDSLGGGGAVLTGDQYAGVIGPHQTGGVIPPPPTNVRREESQREAAAPAPTEDDEEEHKHEEEDKEEKKEEEAKPAPQKPVITGDFYKSYELALCNQAAPQDSIARLMSDVMQKYAPVDNEQAWVTHRRTNFSEAKREMLRSILKKIQELKSVSEKKALYESYVSFVNKNFKPKTPIDSGKELSDVDIDKRVSEFEQESAISDFVVAAKYTKGADQKSKLDPAVPLLVEMTFNGGSPKVVYAAKDSSVSWLKDETSPRLELCSKLAFNGKPAEPEVKALANQKETVKKEENEKFNGWAPWPQRKGELKEFPKGVPPSPPKAPAK